MTCSIDAKQQLVSILDIQKLLRTPLTYFYRVRYWLVTTDEQNTNRGSSMGWGHLLEGHLLSHTQGSTNHTRQHKSLLRCSIRCQLSLTQKKETQKTITKGSEVSGPFQNHIQFLLPTKTMKPILVNPHLILLENLFLFQLLIWLIIDLFSYQSFQYMKGASPDTIQGGTPLNFRVYKTIKFPHFSFDSILPIFSTSLPD